MRRGAWAALILLAMTACSRHPRWFAGTLDQALKRAASRGSWLMVEFTADW